MFLGRSPPISRSQGSARSCPSSPEPRLYACPSPAGRGAALGVSRGPGGPTRSPALDLRPGQRRRWSRGTPGAARVWTWFTETAWGHVLGRPGGTRWKPALFLSSFNH